MEQDLQLQPQLVASRAWSGRKVVVTVLVAFLLGAALAGWLVWHGDLKRVLPRTAQSSAMIQPPAEPAQAQAARELQAMSSLDTRLALLEDRFSRLNLQANAASGNAARAEGLLVAFAARRTIERAQPLGYLADQLRLRFANSQPRAVTTLIDFAQRPVTLSELDANLDVLAPQLADLPRDTTTWTRVQRSLANMFIVRRDPTPSVRPEARLERAKLMLAAGNTEEAVDEVSRMSGAAVAADWIKDARRYGAVQQALDVIETAAMIESHGLQDGAGRQVDQPSPLARPAVAPSAGT